MHRYLKDHPCYAQLVHLMHEGFRITGYGQCLDVLTESQSKQSSECNGKVSNGEVVKQTNGHQHGCNLSVYKIDRYLSIVKYKTSFYTFVLSTRLALYLANRTDPAEHRLVESIMLKIGELFQVQDDYIDCYGDPELTGKIGTDIRDGKCSWLVVKALERANAEQRAILQSNYAQHSDECERRVKSLYKQLNMTEVYHTYETETLNTILNQINQLKETSKVPVEIFYEPLSHVYNREK